MNTDNTKDNELNLSYLCSSVAKCIRRQFMRFVVAVSFVLLCRADAGAQAPDPKSYSPQKHAVRESRGHKATMRDGVKLSVDFYRPEGKGKRPAILFHTPYSNNSPGWAERARGFARRGY